MNVLEVKMKTVIVRWAIAVYVTLLADVFTREGAAAYVCQNGNGTPRPFQTPKKRIALAPLKPKGNHSRTNFVRRHRSLDQY